MAKSEFKAWFKAQYGTVRNVTTQGRELAEAERAAEIAREKWRATRDQAIRHDAALKAWNAARHKP